MSGIGFVQQMHFKPSILFQNNPRIMMSKICIHGFFFSVK
jgi:hypothetical protein